MKIRNTIAKNISKLLSISLLLVFLAGCTLYMDELDGYSTEDVANGDGYTSPKTIADTLGTVTYQFAEGTVYYQEPSRPYISNVATDTTAHTVEFTLAGDTPAKWIPQRGCCIATDMIDLFEEGLNHKVDVVEKTGNGYIVKARMVSLREVYDVLDVDYDVYLVFDSIPDETVSRSGDGGDYSPYTLAVRPAKKKTGTRLSSKGDDDSGMASGATPVLSFGLAFGHGKGETPNSLLYDMIQTSPGLLEAAAKITGKEKKDAFHDFFYISEEAREEFVRKVSEEAGDKKLATTYYEFTRDKLLKLQKRTNDLTAKSTKLQKVWGLDSLNKINSILQFVKNSVKGDFYLGATSSLYIKLDGHIHLGLFDDEEGDDFSYVTLKSWAEFSNGLWELGNLGFDVKIPILTTRKGEKAFFKLPKAVSAPFFIGPILCTLQFGGSLTLGIDGSFKNIPASGFYNQCIIPVGGLEFDSRRSGLDQFRSIEMSKKSDFCRDVSDGKPASTGDQVTTLGFSIIPELRLGLAAYETLVVNFGLEFTGRGTVTSKSNTAYVDFSMPKVKQPFGNLYDVYNLTLEAGYNTLSFKVRPKADVSLDLKKIDMMLTSWEAKEALTLYERGDYDWPQLTAAVRTDWNNTTDTTTAYTATVTLQNKSYRNTPISDVFLLLYKKDDGYVIKDGVPVELKAGEYLGKVECTGEPINYKKPSSTAEFNFTLPGGVMAGEFYAVPAYDKGTGNVLVKYQIGFSRPTVFSQEDNDGMKITDASVPFLTNDFNDGAALVSPGYGDVMNLPLQFEVGGINAIGEYENLAVRFIVDQPNSRPQTVGPYTLKIGKGVVEGKYFFLLSGVPKIAPMKDFNYSESAPTSSSQIEIQLIGLLPGYSHASSAEKEEYETTLSTMYVGVTTGYSCESIKDEYQRQNEGAWEVGYCPDVKDYAWYYFVDITTKDSDGKYSSPQRVTGYTPYDEIDNYCRKNQLDQME